MAITTGATASSGFDLEGTAMGYVREVTFEPTKTHDSDQAIGEEAESQVIVSSGGIVRVRAKYDGTDAAQAVVEASLATGGDTAYTRIEANFSGATKAYAGPGDLLDARIIKRVGAADDIEMTFKFNGTISKTA